MFDNLPQLISDYGYWVLFLGALLEGETVVILAGVSARLGLLDLRWVFVVAACGAFAGDQSLFWIGRGRGEAVAARLPRLAAFTTRANRLIARYPNALVVGLRFAYGLRTPLPILIGASGYPPLRFALLDAIGVTTWAATMCLVGWFFGNAAERALRQVQEAQVYVFAALVALGLAVWAWFRWRRRRLAGRNR
ncbi:MAG TPA: DedA family protein [Ramlibacter sp.]|nr:DedA family protein [Ramlibacter sp.]